MKNLFRKVLFDIVFWTIIIVGLAYASYTTDSVRPTIKDVLYIEMLVIFPLMIPIYLHAFIFNRFFLKNKYYHYISLTIIIFVISSISYDMFINYVSKGDIQANGFLLILILGTIYTGLKYLKIGTKHDYKIRTEEERRLKVEAELHEADARKKKAELQLLKNQISPHFLFNTLNSLYYLALEKSDQAPEIILQLSDMMRYILATKEDQSVNLEKELDFISNYIHMEKLRFDDICDIKLEINGITNNKKIPPFIFIPFVENCFKHGISTNSNKNFIKICVTNSKKELQFEAENSIIKSMNRNDVSGVGLSNLKRRLEILYPSKHKLETNFNDKTYNVSLNIYWE